MRVQTLMILLMGCSSFAEFGYANGDENPTDSSQGHQLRRMHTSAVAPSFQEQDPETIAPQAGATTPVLQEQKPGVIAPQAGATLIAEDEIPPLSIGSVQEERERIEQRISSNKEANDPSDPPSPVSTNTAEYGSDDESGSGRSIYAPDEKTPEQGPILEALSNGALAKRDSPSRVICRPPTPYSPYYSPRRLVSITRYSSAMVPPACNTTRETSASPSPCRVTRSYTSAVPSQIIPTSPIYRGAPASYYAGQPRVVSVRYITPHPFYSMHTPSNYGACYQGYPQPYAPYQAFYEGASYYY